MTPTPKRARSTPGPEQRPRTRAADGIGRIPIMSVHPSVDGGRFPAKAVVGEAVPLRVNAFREGHDAMGVEVVARRPDGAVHERIRLALTEPGLDLWTGALLPDREGKWTFHVEAFADLYGTWEHGARIKVDAGIDVELMIAEGVLVIRRALDEADRPAEDREALTGVLAALEDEAAPAAERIGPALSDATGALFDRRPLRDLVTVTDSYDLVVERELALYGSWYEFFPRSVGARFDPDHGGWIGGTLRTAAEDLPRIAAMGFDVAYLTPIHPIGTTFRKGRNNTLDPEEGDPGSPYAIGSPDGGHDAIHPELGTMDDFDAFVAAARSHGLEVALDLALQCSPDHPWVTEHPEWFTTRADGTIAYAENPPKKYQDIYPLNFDNDPEGIYVAVRDVLELWVEHGVTLFRVDNPHTKPLTFWQRLLAEFSANHPEVIFLAEAFTRPTMMHTLAKVGFQQSYTYFAWRHTPEEFEEYLTELAGDAAAYMRPSFWPTTHDILTPFMQQGRAAFTLRAILAATLSPTWGIYSGYELVEDVPRPGVEEQIDNEKYEFRPRDYAGALETGASLQPLLTRLNEIRRSEAALQRLTNIVFHEVEDPTLLAFSKHTPAEHSPTGATSTVIVVSMTEARGGRGGRLRLDREALGIRHAGPFAVEDLLTGERFWWDDEPVVFLDAEARCAHILRVIHSEEDVS